MCTNERKINEFKESLNDIDEVSDDGPDEENDASEFAPTLWFGLTKPTSKEELLLDLPSRQVTDRMVHYFLNSEEPVASECLEALRIYSTDLPIAQIFCMDLLSRARWVMVSPLQGALLTDNSTTSSGRTPKTCLFHGSQYCMRS
jgi:hypothetical protein